MAISNRSYSLVRRCFFFAVFVMGGLVGQRWLFGEAVLNPNLYVSSSSSSSSSSRQSHGSSSLRTVQVLLKKGQVERGLKELSLQRAIYKIRPFSVFSSPFFSRLFDIQIPKEFSINYFNKFSFVEGVHEPQKIVLQGRYQARVPQHEFSDILYRFQWAHENIYFPEDERAVYPERRPELARGHLTEIASDNDKIELVTSRPSDGSSRTFDINWGPVSKGIARATGNSIVVAVIDSGIELSHRDLRDNIYKKEEQCDNGVIPKLRPPLPERPSGGQRGVLKVEEAETYEGDCMGWNFVVASKTSVLRNQPFDNLGHGTQVSGLLSAITNNNEGIVGISDRIKIMPLKVVGSTLEERERNKKLQISGLKERTEGFTSHLAKAIRYATHNGAQVINMSLGWPKIAQISIVQEAIQEALDHNIIIVAAAGNDGHSSPILPCAIEGVICVGAVDNRGVVPNFSNYGAHVDLVAPGKDILSTSRIDFNPNNFDIKGYDVSSGNSMAAPFVSGLAALLRLQNPRISREEVRRRLITSTRPVFRHQAPGRLLNGLERDPKTFVKEDRAIGGMVQFEAALNQHGVSQVAPRMKTLKLVSFQSESLVAPLEFDVESLKGTQNDVRVSIETNRSDLTVVPDVVYIDKINVGKVQRVKFKIHMTSPWIESELEFKVAIRGAGLDDRKYYHSVYLTRSLEFDPRVIRVNTTPSSPEVSAYRPVHSPRWSLKKPTLFATKAAQPSGISLEFVQFSPDDSSFRRVTPVYVPNLAVNMWEIKGPHFTVYSEDFSGNGQSDYLVVGIYKKIEKGGVGNYLQFSYFNHDFQPLFGKDSHWSWKYGDGVSPNFEQVQFLRKEILGVGSVPVPIFQNMALGVRGQRPKKMSFLNNQAVFSGVFILEPFIENGQVTLKTRLESNLFFENSLKKQLNIQSVDRLSLIGLLPQTAQDFREGKVKLQYAYDHIRKNRSALVSLKYQNFAMNNEKYPKWSELLESKNIPNLENHQIMAVHRLSPSDWNPRWGVSLTTNSNLKKTTNYVLSPELLTRPMREFRSETQKISEFYQRPMFNFELDDYGVFVYKVSDKNIAVTRDNSGTQKIFRRKTLQSSFLPGYFFTELFFPSAIHGEDGNLRAAVYVDASGISSDHAMFWVIEKDRTYVPAHLNIRIPKGCHIAAKVWNQDQKAENLILYCQKLNQAYFSILSL